MMHTLGPVILLSTLAVCQTKADGVMTPTVVEPGGNFSMSCSLNRADVGLLYFYKVSLESLIQTIAGGPLGKLTCKGNFTSPRFLLSDTKVDNSVLYTLSISNVRKEDGATYVCQAGSSYKMSFFNATLLIVNDQEKHFFHVEQTPQASAPLGDPVQLNCSVVSKNECLQRCPSKRNVHWFRAGASASAASVMYTYEDQRDEQLQRTCVYSLSTTIETYEDTGPYYCAVAACGHVLFGAGTNVNISSDRPDLLPVCAALGLLLICSVVANALMLCRFRKAAHANGLSASKHLEILDTIAADQSNVKEDTMTGVTYAVVDFPQRKAKRSNIQTRSPSECLYSAPRAHH